MTCWQARQGKSLETKRAVVMDPGEKRLHVLMQKVHTIRNDKDMSRLTRVHVFGVARRKTYEQNM